MDGQSGFFFNHGPMSYRPPRHQFGAPTMSFHVVDAGPVAGDYLNVGVEEGFDNWLEFGFTRNNHTDGGDPTTSAMHLYVALSEACCDALPCRRDPADHEIVAIGPSREKYIFL
jgi:hypothetical protein